jgi:hypothetical protein
VGVLGPDERLQPGHIRRIGHVERIQVQAGPPHHLGQVPRWHRSGGRAFEDRSARADRVLAVVVGVPAGIETQAGGGADLQQRQGLRQRGEHRQQQGTPSASLVCVARVRGSASMAGQFATVKS